MSNETDLNLWARTGVENPTDLTLAQRERLAYLAEEASEVIQRCMKILRFGYTEGYDPKKLEEEIGHMMLGVDLLVEEGDIDWNKCIDSREKKREYLQGSRLLRYNLK